MELKFGLLPHFKKNCLKWSSSKLQVQKNILPKKQLAWTGLASQFRLLSLPHDLKWTLNINGSYGNCWYERLCVCRALNRLRLCDQYLSGPIHREPGVFIAARASVWASHTKGRLGFCWSLSLPYKVGVLRMGRPTSQGHRKCHKRRIISDYTPAP